MDANFLTAGSHEARGSLFKTLTQGNGKKLATVVVVERAMQGRRGRLTPDLEPPVFPEL